MEQTLQREVVTLNHDKPELLLPRFDSLFAEELTTENELFYKASREIIANCVNLVPVEDEKHPYHNREHTISVLLAFTEIAELAYEDEAISSREFMLGLIACAAHDIEYDKDDKKNAGHNEQRSIEFVHAMMDKKDEVFTQKDKDIVSECIDATTFEGVGENGEILQKSAESILARLVVDADVCNLSMDWDDFKRQFEAYYKELEGLSIIDRTAKIYFDFIRFEIRVLTAHTYKSPYAQRLWVETRGQLEKNKARLRSLLP